MRRGLRLPLLFLLAWTATGCGSGGLSASEYRQKADAICKQAAEKINRYDPKTPAQVRNVAGKIEPIVGDAVADLKDLDPPKDLDDAANRWNDTNDQLVTGLGKLHDTKSDDELRQEAQTYSDLNDEANRIASDELGLKECSK